MVCAFVFFLFSLSERARLLKNVRNVFTFRSENNHANVELELNRKLFHMAIFWRYINVRVLQIYSFRFIFRLSLYIFFSYFHFYWRSFIICRWIRIFSRRRWCGFSVRCRAGLWYQEKTKLIYWPFLFMALRDSQSLFKSCIFFSASVFA